MISTRSPWPLMWGLWLAVLAAIVIVSLWRLGELVLRACASRFAAWTVVAFWHEAFPPS